MSYAQYQARRRRIYNERERKPHFIYVLRGPSGVYVGCTVNPHLRKRAHFALARVRKSFIHQPVHHVMRRDGFESYAFEVVAQSRTWSGGRETEQSLIAQLIREGEHVLNARDRAPAKRRRPYVHALPVSEVSA